MRIKAFVCLFLSTVLLFTACSNSTSQSTEASSEPSTEASTETYANEYDKKAHDLLDAGKYADAFLYIYDPDIIDKIDDFNTIYTECISKGSKDIFDKGLELFNNNDFLTADILLEAVRSNYSDPDVMEKLEFINGLQGTWSDLVGDTVDIDNNVVTVNTLVGSNSPIESGKYEMHLGIHTPFNSGDDKVCLTDENEKYSIIESDFNKPIIEEQTMIVCNEKSKDFMFYHHTSNAGKDYQQGVVSRPTDNTTGNSNLLIEDDSFTKEGNYWYCKGAIVNNSDKPYSNVKVKVSYFDENNEMITTDWTYAVDSVPLEPGEKKRFEIMTEAHGIAKVYKVEIVD